MGLFNQFIEVIEWTDTHSDRIVYRFPVSGNEIKMGAQLTVRETQVAIFINEGQLADVFEPGRYRLSTENMPILSKLKAWKYGFNSPFKAEVYFVNTKQFLDQRWGTNNPIMMRDAEFGMIRLRGFGSYAYRVSDPVVFMREVLGSSAFATTDAISPQLTKQIISALSDLIAEANIPALDLARNYDELSEALAKKVAEQFSQYGLAITNFTIENLSLPKEVEEAMDKRTQMGVLGDLGRYSQFQTAEAIKDAANNPGGMAGIGAGMGAAAQMAGAMAQSFSQPAARQTTPSTAQHNAVKYCNNCGNQVAIDSKFCSQCGNKFEQTALTCRACHKPIAPDAKFCSHCGAKQTAG